MKNFFKKYKIYLGIAGYLLFVAAMTFLAIMPLISEINSRNNGIQEKITDQENRKERLEKIPAIKEQSEKIKGEEEKVNIILTKDNIVDLIKKIEKVSEETNNKVKIEVIEDFAKKAAAKAKKDDNQKSLADKLGNQEFVAMDINLAGNYQSFIDFVRKIENMEYYSDIISIKMTKEKDKSGDRPANPFDGIGEEDVASGNNIYSTLEVIFYLKK